MRSTEYRTARRFRQPSPLFRWAASKGLLEPPGDVLVFGAGLLVEAEALAQLGWRVDALETKTSVHRRESVYAEFAARPGVRTITGLEAARKKYRLIVVTHVLEFIEAPRERARVLRDLAGRVTREGILLLSLRGWSDVRAAKRQEHRGDGIVTGLGTWTRGYTVEEARSLIAEAGLEVAATPHPRATSPEQVRLVCRRKS